MLKILGKRHISINIDGIAWHGTVGAQLRSLYGADAATHQQEAMVAKGSQLCFLWIVVLS